jgi:hypothetical protein
MNESVKKFTSFTVFVVELIFIFFIGLLYAFIQPEELWVKSVFLLIAFGWVIYIIRSVWDFIEKKNYKNNHVGEVEITIEQPKELKK